MLTPKDPVNNHTDDTTTPKETSLWIEWFRQQITNRFLNFQIQY